MSEWGAARWWLIGFDSRRFANLIFNQSNNNLMKMNLMDFEAIEAYETEQAALEPWEVWFRDEYFGQVPEELVTDVALIMAKAGGLFHDPVNRRLEAWHGPGTYHDMVTAIVARINQWMSSAPLRLTNETEV